MPDNVSKIKYITGRAIIKGRAKPQKVVVKHNNAKLNAFTVTCFTDNSIVEGKISSELNKRQRLASIKNELMLGHEYMTGICAYITDGKFFNWVQNDAGLDLDLAYGDPELRNYECFTYMINEFLIAHHKLTCGHKYIFPNFGPESCIVSVNSGAIKMMTSEFMVGSQSSLSQSEI